MRVLVLSLYTLVAALATLAGQSQTPAADASAIVASAREALGGEKRLSAVKTFVINGRTRQIQGDNLVPIEFEISCELPDRCVRRDEIPARESGPTANGFNGDELIQIPAPPTPPPGAGPPPVAGRGGPPPQLAAVRVNTAKQDFARWWLGMFVGSFSSFPITFAPAGTAEAPQGQADVLDARGPANFASRLFILKESHLPIMLTWQGQALGKPAEYRLYYADYRDVDGLKLPFRIRRAIGADTTEETNVDRFRINARIDPRRFEVRR
ncbi:MAG TPA: hypothetical protein VKB50_30395 [Vicinamibacterales bacterium]|nr:hypothetical protein [Vicinamibacterales bacterium]